MLLGGENLAHLVGDGVNKLDEKLLNELDSNLRKIVRRIKRMIRKLIKRKCSKFYLNKCNDKKVQPKHFKIYIQIFKTKMFWRTFLSLHLFE